MSVDENDDVLAETVVVGGGCDPVREGRLKSFHIGLHFLLSVVGRKKFTLDNRHIVLQSLPGVADDPLAYVMDIFYDHTCRSFAVTVASPNFPPVTPGDRIPCETHNIRYESREATEFADKPELLAEIERLRVECGELKESRDAAKKMTNEVMQLNENQADHIGSLIDKNKQLEAKIAELETTLDDIRERSRDI